MILITLFWRAACVCLFFNRKRRGRTQGGVRRANIGSDFNTFENDTGHICFRTVFILAVQFDDVCAIEVDFPVFFITLK